MDKKPDKIRDIFIEALGNFGESLGLNRTTCQIYALLYLSCKPLSPTEIGNILKMSKGNVSLNIRKLEEWDAIKRVWRKGYSRAVFQANHNFEDIILRKLENGLKKRTEQLKNYICEIIKIIENLNKVDNERTKEIKFYKEKIKFVNNFINKIDSLLENFEYIKSFIKK